jgi:hypothetical protein
MKTSVFGRTRSEQEKNLRSEGYNSLTDEQLDKSGYIEKKLRDITGSKNNFLSQADIDKFDDTIPGSINIGVQSGWNKKSQKFFDNFDAIDWDN